MSESKAVKYRYQKLRWEVTGLSEDKAKRYQSGDSIESEIFSIVLAGNVTELSITMFPNGAKAKNKGSVDLFLNLKRKMLNNFNTIHKFGISCGKKNYITGETMRSKMDWEDTEGIGFHNFISHATLFNPYNECFNAGKLTIFCDVRISMVQEVTAAVKLAKTVKDFSKMFKKEELKDCELHTRDDIVLKCHKSILAARSPVFESFFKSGKSVIKIWAFDSKTMIQLLRFAYCLEVQQLDVIAGDLIYAADNYQINELKEICIDSLIDNLNQGNVFDTLIVAKNISDCNNLLDDCLNVITINYQVLSKTAGWRKLTKPILLEIIECMALQNVSSSNFYRSTTI